MTISETIAYLEKLKEKHGDIEIEFATRWASFSISYLTMEQDRNGQWALVLDV